MINGIPSDYRGQERQNSESGRFLSEIGSWTDVPFITQIARTAAESESYR